MRVREGIVRTGSYKEGRGGEGRRVIQTREAIKGKGVVLLCVRGGKNEKRGEGLHPSGPSHFIVKGGDDRECVYSSSLSTRHVVGSLLAPGLMSNSPQLCCQLSLYTTHCICCLSMPVEDYTAYRVVIEISFCLELVLCFSLLIFFLNGTLQNSLALRTTHQSAQTRDTLRTLHRPPRLAHHHLHTPTQAYILQQTLQRYTVNLESETQRHIECV